MRLGIEFGGTHIKVGMVSENGTVIRDDIKKLRDFSESDNLVHDLKEYVNNFISNDSIDKGGISSKGLVDTNKGQVIDDVGAEVEPVREENGACEEWVVRRARKWKHRDYAVLFEVYQEVLLRE